MLVDFWTYTCINCIRTLPYLKAWDKRYRKAGLVIVGVHTPEFPFERDESNVRDAIAQNELRYPVAQDNDYAVWQAYQNNYWPASYFIDAEGQVRYVHFGEGAYDEKEQVIRAAARGGGRAARRADERERPEGVTRRHDAGDLPRARRVPSASRTGRSIRACATSSSRPSCPRTTSATAGAGASARRPPPRWRARGSSSSSARAACIWCSARAGASRAR